MNDPGVVNQSRGEYVIYGKPDRSGRRSEYPVAYTLAAFEEFERQTGKVALDLVMHIVEIVTAHDLDMENLQLPEAITLGRVLSIGTTDVKQMIRCGLIGYADHGKSRGTPKLGDARLSEIIADVGGVMAVFVQVAVIWLRSELLMGDLLTDLDGESADDDEGEAADPS